MSGRRRTLVDEWMGGWVMVRKKMKMQERKKINKEREGEREGEEGDRRQE